MHIGKATVILLKEGILKKQRTNTFCIRRTSDGEETLFSKNR
jgi:hypothetical protein